MRIEELPRAGSRYFVRMCYVVAGGVMLALGVIGAFLPVMPTTVFVLGAAWCFSRGSPSAEKWLTERSPFRRVISNWRRFRMIPLSAKCLAGLSLSICLPVLFVVLGGDHIAFWLVAGALSALYGYMWSFPHTVPEAEGASYNLGGAGTEGAHHA